MANEKISEFAIDSAIEGVDGLAAMRITNPNTADPQGGVPVEFGNVAVPGFAFTLENILKAKTDRSDLTDSGNWSTVPSNVIPSSGTNDPTEGLMFKRSNGDNTIQVYHQGGGQTLYFENKYQLGQLRSGVVFLNQSDWQVMQDGDNSTLWMENKRNGAGYGVKIQSGTDVSTAADFLINARGTNANLDVFSGKNINIKSGKGVGGQQAGDIVVTLGTTNPTANQVLASKDANGTLEWQDKTVNTDTQYVLDTVELTGGDVKVELKDNAATPNVVGDILFEKGDGILFEDTTTGTNGSFKVSQSAATNTTFGGIKIGYPESGKFYPVELNGSNQAYVNVPWTDTQNTYTAGDGLDLDNFEFSISAPIAYSLGGTGTTSNSQNGVVFAGSSAYQTEDYFKFEAVSGGTASAVGILSIGKAVTGSPEDGWQGVLKLKGQGDQNEDPYDDSGRLDLECQTGGHNFHLVGPNHDGMSYSPGIVLPSDIGTAGQVLVLDAVPNSGSVRTATTKWDSPANNKKAFISLLDAGGTATSWDIKNGYNAKIDFAASSGTEYDFTTNTITATNGDYGTLVVINGATAGTIEFPASSRWVGGNTPTATDGGVDIYSFVYDGTNYYWTYGLDNKA